MAVVTGGGNRSGVCPYCGSEVETDLACSNCGASTQERVAWVIATAFRLWQPGGAMLHHMPTAATARRFHALLGSSYHATLPPGMAQPTAHVPFHSFDPATEADALAPDSYRLIVIGHGLLEAGAAVPAVLEALSKSLSPGGSLLFGGDVVDAEGRVASAALGQIVMAGANGVSSFGGLVRRQFKRECRIRPGQNIDTAQIEKAGLSPSLMRRVTPDTLFWYQS